MISTRVSIYILISGWTLFSPLFSMSEDGKSIIDKVKKKEQKGNYSSAIKGLSLGISRYSDTSQLYYSRGILKLRLKFYTEALSDFNQVILLDSLNDKSYAVRGRIKFELHDFKGAQRDCDKAIELNNTNEEAF